NVTDEENPVISRTELVSAIQSLMQTKVLQVAAGLEIAETMEDQLQEFRMRDPQMSKTDPEQWAEMAGKDLVFAVGMCCWHAAHNLPVPKSQRSREDRLMREHMKAVDEWVV
ncbi:MAG: hypothetical protein AAGH60_14385, partial [Pseudomonadota bacterium]